MTKQSFLLVFFLLILALLLGFNYFFKPFAYLAQNQAASTEIEEPTDEPQLSKTEEIVATLTPRQRITQLLAVPLTVNQTIANPILATQSAQLTWIQENNPGAVVLFGNNVSTAAAATAISLLSSNEVTSSNESTPSNELAPFIAVDHEGGTVQRLRGEGFSILPSWAELCQRSQVDAQVAVEQSAQELRSMGVDIILAPVLDVSTNNRVLGSRICSGDFNLVGERARLVATTYLKHQIMPVFKHFPGIGQTTTDLHTGFDTVSVSEDEARLYRELLDFYTATNSAAIQEEWPSIGVMTAHVGVENQDPTVPCSMSSHCVSQLTDNFPTVLVFSDDVLMVSAYQGISKEEQTLTKVVLQAILAGNQQIIIGPGVTANELNDMVLLVEEAYRNNTLVQRVIDHSVAQVVQHKVATMVE